MFSLIALINLILDHVSLPISLFLSLLLLLYLSENW